MIERFVRLDLLWGRRNRSDGERYRDDCEEMGKYAYFARDILIEDLRIRHIVIFAEGRFDGSHLQNTHGHHGYLACNNR